MNICGSVKRLKEWRTGFFPARKDWFFNCLTSNYTSYLTICCSLSKQLNMFLVKNSLFKTAVPFLNDYYMFAFIKYLLFSFNYIYSLCKFGWHRRKNTNIYIQNLCVTFIFDISLIFPCTDRHTSWNTTCLYFGDNTFPNLLYLKP